MVEIDPIGVGREVRSRPTVGRCHERRHSAICIYPNDVLIRPRGRLCRRLLVGAGRALNRNDPPFGAILNARLAADLPTRIPPAALAEVGGDVNALLNSPAAIRALPPEVAAGIATSVELAVRTVFLWSVPLMFTDSSSPCSSRRFRCARRLVRSSSRPSRPMKPGSSQTSSDEGRRWVDPQ